MRSIPSLTPRQIERFWSNVDQSGGFFACWPWTGYRNTNGYGKLSFYNQVYLAHRVAYVLMTQDDTTLPLLHSCDNPPCCNPAHLHYGTQAENIAEMAERRRNRRGISHSSAKLTDDDVREIRRLHIDDALGWRRLAGRFGVSGSVINAILAGESWSHVPLPDGWQAITERRPATVRGERNPGAKLSASIVAEMRRCYAAGGVSAAAIARQFGISNTQAKRILSGQSWKHLE